MSQQPMIGTRVPESWRQELRRRAKECGRRPAHLVYDAIAAYLGEESGGLDGQVSQMALRLEQVERQVAALKALIV